LWGKACKKHPDVWDQQVLEGCIEKWGMAFEELPDSYCHVYDPDSTDKLTFPVIEHYIASRRESRNPKWNLKYRDLESGDMIYVK
jgi:hypothetical protein